ncbi:DUF4834 family protein [Flavobacteriaceae bacterium]|nr:DUF4834 family protein [Flavobacteriaceae bacterium]
MQEAGFINFVRTILIILTIYYLVKFFVKYVAPVLLVKYVQKKTAQQQGQQSYNDDVVKEGTTIIEKKPSEKTSSSVVGEYVDFEEIKD